MKNDTFKALVDVTLQFKDGFSDESIRLVAAEFAAADPKLAELYTNWCSAYKAMVLHIESKKEVG